MHLPQKNNANWQELRVMISGAGEAGWRRCDTCTGLFWTKNGNSGKCASSEAHLAVQGESYVVDCRTI
jgi:hypothetical protein